jgi:3-dehydroquinate dehydratase-1
MEMNKVQVRNIVIGEGMPKICAPIVGRTREEILLQTRELKAAEPDLAEWRADWFEKALEKEQLREMLELLRGELGELPLLVTFRTGQEGGEQEISLEDYEKFLSEVLASGQADVIDVELFMGEELLSAIAKKAHREGVKVIASSHDFEKTPNTGEIVERLCRMQKAGADLLKLAAMPRDPGDVLTLLAATWQMKECYARQPVITMSMGGTGVISRLAGEIFGSALTFGAAGRASAPGQVGAKELREVLKLLHEKL